MEDKKDRIIIAQLPYEYTFEKNKGQYIFSIHEPIGGGRDVAAYLNEADFLEYQKKPENFIKQKVKELKSNPTNYRIKYWR